MSTRVEEDPLPYYVNVVTGLIPKWCWRQALFQTGYSYSSKEICEVKIILVYKFKCMETNQGGHTPRLRNQ